MPGLHLHRSNRLEALVALLAENLRHVGGDPIAPVEVVVGSRGMERHLRHVLGEHLGLCANVAFPFPNAALDAAIGMGEGGRADPWSPDVLVWAILEVLPALVADPRAAPLRRYLGAGDVERVDARTYGLARRLAELLDRYVTYRPELATGWSAGVVEPLPAEHAWQPVLWEAVRAQLQAAPHRAERLRAAFDVEGVEVDEIDRPLRIFGLSTLPGSWLDAIGRLARHRNIELYLLCPSDQYWGDLGRRSRAIPSLRSVSRDEVPQLLRSDEVGDRLADGGHPLLVSWGKVARDAQILLQSLPEDVDDRGGDLFLDPLFGAPDSPTALQRLQDDVLHAVHPTAREGYASRSLDPADRSVQLHACHGPTRQVEVLRDVILGLLEDDRSLQPRDIVVMTPDIEAYAPLVAAVFDQGEVRPGPGGWARSGTPRVPFEIADLALRRLNPVADALLRVLELVDGRVTSAEVLDLLAVEPVAARFGVAPEDLATFRGWVVGSGVRWAIDGEHRTTHDQPRDDQNTWRFGLDRMLLGVVMQDDGRLLDGVRPYDPIEGAASGRLGRLVDFCTTLFEHLDALRAPRALDAWVDALDATVLSLTSTTGEAAWLTRRVRDLLATLRTATTLSGSARLLGIDAVRAALEGQLDVASAASHGSGGAVTFCGMVPERAVPYRVVVLLGMDEGAFPRAPARPAFDLTLHPPRVGDRDLRDEDRYLMLEAVLSARQHLVVLYTGRDLRTNQPRPPAVPVAELCDALDATWPALDGLASPSVRLTREHVLQAFDPRCFEAAAGSEPWAFDARLLGPARASLGVRSPTPPFLPLDLRVAANDADGHGVEDTLEVGALAHFWANPVRAFLQRRLRLWLPYDGEDEVPEREPIEPGWIEKADLLRELLAALAEGRETKSLHRALRSEGRLPLGSAGDVAFASVLTLARAMQATAHDVVGWTPASAVGIDVDLSLGGARLVGRLDGCTKGALVRFAYGDESARELLAAWIALLARCADDPTGPGRALVVFGKVKGDGSIEEPKPIGLQVDAPGDLLARLVALRREGLDRPLPFFLKTSHKLASAALGKGGLEPEAADPAVLARGGWDDEVDAVLRGALRGAWSAWFGAPAAPGEVEERYLRLAFRGTAPFEGDDGAPDPRFAALAISVFGPLLAARMTPGKLKDWGNA